VQLWRQPTPGLGVPGGSQFVRPLVIAWSESAPHAEEAAHAEQLVRFWDEGMGDNSTL